MRNVLFSLALYVAAAQGAPLVLFFGPGSSLDLDDGHGLPTPGICTNIGNPCSGSDGTPLGGFLSPPWDGRSIMGVEGLAAFGSTSFILDLHFYGFVEIACMDDTCAGEAPNEVYASALVAGNINLMVDLPYSGFVSYDKFVDGQFVSREVRSASAGVQQLAQVGDAIGTIVTLKTLGRIDIDERRTVELRNIQLTPEPGSLGLVGAALALLPLSRFRRH